MSAGRLAVFGQEFYFEESLRAIERIGDLPENTQLNAAIAELLPHPAESTRLRVASKIAQRFFRHGDDTSLYAPFSRFAQWLKSDSDRRDLLYWRTARTDRLIAAISAEVIYPYFVLQELPAGYDDTTFRLANRQTLLSVDRAITIDLVKDYARRAWGFESTRTITLALRIMRQARILDAASIEAGEHHVTAYFPTPHSMSPDVFAYCVYEEFARVDRSLAVSLDRIYNADCVKLFLLTRLQGDSMLRTLEQNGLIEPTGSRGTKQIRFAYPSIGALVDRLIEGTE